MIVFLGLFVLPLFLVFLSSLFLLDALLCQSEIISFLILSISGMGFGRCVVGTFLYVVVVLACCCYLPPVEAHHLPHHLCLCTKELCSAVVIHSPDARAIKYCVR